MAVVAAAALAAERRIVRHLQGEGATSAAAAVAYRPERGFHVRRLHRLIRRGVVREAAPGRFYVDAAALDSYRQRQRTVAGTVLIGAILAAAAAVAFL